MAIFERWVDLVPVDFSLLGKKQNQINVIGCVVFLIHRNYEGVITG